MNKKEIKFIASKIIILFMVVGVIAYLTKPQPPKKDLAVEVSEKMLSETRQILWIKVDSLVGYLSKIDKQQPNIFSVKDEDNRLVFKSLDEKPFNNIFLDGEYLSRFDKVSNSGIEKTESTYGFSLPIKKKSGIRFVIMPTEIIHSIQLQKR